MRRSMEERGAGLGGRSHLLIIALLIAALYFYPGDLSLGQRTALAIILAIPAFLLASIIKDLLERGGRG